MSIFDTTYILSIRMDGESKTGNLKKKSKSGNKMGETRHTVVVFLLLYCRENFGGTILWLSQDVGCFAVSAIFVKKWAAKAA